jgi:hypothetical protein
VLGLGLALYVYDYRGRLETVRGEVVSTRSYPHETPTEPPHSHTEAVIEAEGRRFTVREADGVEVGQPVTVVVSRGRLTGRTRFVALGPVSRTR